MPTTHSRVYFLDIRVDDYDRIVHNHPQCHNKRSQRNGVEFYAHGVEKPKSDEDGNGNCACRNTGNAHGKQQHDDHNHRDDSDEKLF